MSWRYRFLVLFSLAALTGCGFSPVYAKREGSDSTRFSSIHVMPVAGRNGQILKASLEDLMGIDEENIDTPYQLESSMTVDYIPVVIESDGTVSRYRIDITIPVNLKENSSGASAFSTRVRRSVSYSVSQSDYSSYISSTDALERGIKEASYDIVQRISAFLAKP